MLSFIRRAFIARASGIVFALAMPCFAPPAASAEIVIKIDNFVFKPDNVAIKVGDTVKWENNDDIPHSVVSSPVGAFKSKAMDTEETFTFMFGKAGEFAYFCGLHPHMKAKIIVAP